MIFIIKIDSPVKDICLIYKVHFLYNNLYPLFQFLKKIDFKENPIKAMIVFFITPRATLHLKTIIKKN